MRLQALALSAAALSQCHPASKTPAANAPVASSGHAPATTVRSADGGARAPEAQASAACELASDAKAEVLVFDWEKSVARGSFGWVASLAADGNGVFVAGGESSAHAQATPFVASFAADGRQRFRVLLDKIVSTTKPQRAAAAALARTRSGAVYVASWAAQVGTQGRVYLSLLDATGRQRFTTPVDLDGLAVHSLLADSDDNAIVVGVLPLGGFGVIKYTADGGVAWSKSFRYHGDFPHVAEVGKGYVLAGSFQGDAELGGETIANTGNLRYACGGGQADCETPSHALLVIELDRDGNLARVRTFGSPSASISVSGLVALPDGRLTLTGEFFGPKTALGPVSLCEMQPGMPPAEEPRFRETGGAYRCDCRKDQRDLFVLQLGSDATPRWAKTLALGSPEPRVSRSAASDALVWGFHSGGVVALWELGAGGDVLRQRSAPGSFSLLAAAEDRAVYLSDRRNLKRATLK